MHYKPLPAFREVRREGMKDIRSLILKSGFAEERMNRYGRECTKLRGRFQAEFGADFEASFPLLRLPPGNYNCLISRTGI